MQLIIVEAYCFCCHIHNTQLVRTKMTNASYVSVKIGHFLMVLMRGVWGKILLTFFNELTNATSLSCKYNKKRENRMSEYEQKGFII